MIRDLELLRSSLLDLAGQMARSAEAHTRREQEAPSPGVRCLLQGIALAQRQEVDHLERLIAQTELAIATQRNRSRGRPSQYLAASRRHHRRAAGDCG